MSASCIISRHQSYYCAAKIQILIIFPQGVDGIKQYGMELLIQLAAAQLNDRLPEAREVARKLVVDLCSAYHKCPPDAQSMTDFEAADLDFKQQDPWEQFCLSKLSPIMAQAVLRVTCIAT